MDQYYILITDMNDEMIDHSDYFKDKYGALNFYKKYRNKLKSSFHYHAYLMCEREHDDYVSTDNEQTLR